MITVLHSERRFVKLKGGRKAYLFIQTLVSEAKVNLYSEA